MNFPILCLLDNPSLVHAALDVDASTNSTLWRDSRVIGYTMCFGLMGVLAAQCFIYFSKFPNDRLWIRLLVSTVVFLETLFTFFAFHGFWVGVTAKQPDLSSIVAAGVGGHELSPDPIWAFATLSPMTGIVSSLTHGFFCWRIWVVRKSFVVPLLVMVVSLMQCAMVSYGGIVFGLVPDLDASHPMPFYVPAWLCGSLFCDLTITIYMTLILLRTKAEFRDTWSVLVKLAKLTVETGLITTMAAAIELVLALAFRVTLFHMAVFYTISKLYANCLLATLNARLMMRDSSDNTVTVWDHAVSDTPSGPAVPTIQVHKQVTTDAELAAYLPHDRLDHKGVFDIGTDDRHA